MTVSANDRDPATWQTTTLGAIQRDEAKGVVPNRTPKATFELYSVPSHESGLPTIVRGEEIGSNKQTVIPNTVLLCKINPRINRVWVVGDKGHHEQIASTEWIPFFPTDDVLPSYLAWYLRQKTVRDFLASNASGVGGSLMRVKASTLRDFPFRFPSLDEQQRIVAEIEKQFTRLEAGVASLKRVQAALKRYRASVLKAACEGRLVPTEAELARREFRSFEPATILLARVRNERRNNWAGRGKWREPEAPETAGLPSIPDGWTWATMPQLGELNRGKSKRRPRDDANLYGGPYPFIQTGDIRRSRGTIREHTQTYSELGLRQSRLWPVGTVCITIAANIAETGVLTYPACFPDSVVGFVHSDSVTTRFVEFFLRTAKEKLETFAPATAQKNINIDVFPKWWSHSPHSPNNSGLWLRWSGGCQSSKNRKRWPPPTFSAPSASANPSSSALLAVNSSPANTTMDANAVSVLDIFEKKHRLEIPLFQRQYVWNEEHQWAPLWEDISRKVSEYLVGRKDGPVHFLGAMVLDQKQTPTTHVDKRQVINGQQRLTTLQIFLAALRDFCREHNCEGLAQEFEVLTKNAGRMNDPATECYKVWPTQRDREQFRRHGCG